MSKDLEDISKHEEIEVKNFFFELKSKSEEVKEGCNNFLLDMSECRTDLAV